MANGNVDSLGAPDRGIYAVQPWDVPLRSNLRKYAQSIDKDIAKLRRRVADTGSQKHRDRLSRALRQKADGR